MFKTLLIATLFAFLIMVTAPQHHIEKRKDQIDRALIGVTAFALVLAWCLIWLGLGGCIYLSHKDASEPLMIIKIDRGEK